MNQRSSLTSTSSYIGPFIFTRALLPLLCQTAEEPSNDVRVVMVCHDGSDTLCS